MYIINEKYFVVFGNNRYSPDRCYNSCKYKFEKLKDARMYAKRYSNSYIFRIYEDGTIKEMKR